MTSRTATVEALDAFVARYVEAFPALYEPFDPDWRSPAETGGTATLDDGSRIVPWAPLQRGYADDFEGLERALERPVHPDIKAYYGRYWSAGLEATAEEGHVSLILLWNPADVGRLIENLIGHAMAKQRARAPFSVFFACTEPDSELFLSVDNDTGRVLLERPGYEPIKEVAPDLACFLARLTPASPLLHPERAHLASLVV